MEPQGIYKGRKGAEIGGMHLLPGRGHLAKESGQPAQEGISNGDRCSSRILRRDAALLTPSFRPGDTHRGV